jgi:hypothetical protein
LFLTRYLRLCGLITSATPPMIQTSSSGEADPPLTHIAHSAFSHSFGIRHSDWHHSLSIRVIRGYLLSPRGIVSPEEQLLLHAYSQNPLGGLRLKDRGTSPIQNRVFLRTSQPRSRSRRWNDHVHKTCAHQCSSLPRAQSHHLFCIFSLENQHARRRRFTGTPYNYPEVL